MKSAHDLSYFEIKMTAISFKQILYVYKKSVFYFLHRKRRLDTKSEDAIGLEPMETTMSESKTNVYFDSDGTTLIFFKDLIKHHQFKKKYQKKLYYIYECIDEIKHIQNYLHVNLKDYSDSLMYLESAIGKCRVPLFFFF